MTDSGITRRRLLACTALLGIGASTCDSQAAPAAQPRVLTAWTRGDQSWAGVWTPGHKPRGIALPARAHQLLLVPGSKVAPLQALVLARRPGEYLMRMDVQRGKALQWHNMEEDRYLGGHAALSSSGKTFFTSETHAETGQGLISERDLHTLSKIKAFPSGGIGPHALLVEDAGTLLVANGGILNLPETGRRKLNLDTMSPNLTRLDASTGQILAQYTLSDPFLSLRHLTRVNEGTVAVALQAEHEDRKLRSLAPAIALLQGGQLGVVPWDEKTGPPEGWDGYAGDIIHAAGRLWVSAPHTGAMAIWSQDGTQATAEVLQGAGALAGNARCCIVGGSNAVRVFADASSTSRTYPLQQAWDNHAELLPFL